jgi:flavin-dependent dehydrogenase
VFRKGDYLNIGLGREDNQGLGGHIERFCRMLHDSGKVPFDIDARFHGHAYILYGHVLRKLHDERVLLVGDAAGLAYPQSGEGIRPAIESGLMAAETILANRAGPEQAALGGYAERLVGRFGRRGPSPTEDTLLPEAFKQFVAGQLLASPWFSRHVVVNRWFLHNQQPALLPA